MHVTFHGAVREVTGSAHLLENGEDRLLMDCGLIQGRRKETNARNRELPFDAARLTNVVLSHAHIDHSGRLPLLARHTFQGRILATRATQDACQYLLRDAAHIQQSDADYLNYKQVRNYLARERGGGKKGQAEVRRILKKKRHALNTGAINDLMRKHDPEQELLYVLHELYMAQAVPRLPVYVDSPLATQITRVFGEHPEVYDQEAHETFLQNGRNPFRFDQIHFVQSVDESIALTRNEKPHIVISASGMCEAGRILHHLRYKIHNPRNTILIVGFMAQHTLGRRILEQGQAYAAAGRQGPAPQVKFMNKTYPLAAQVVKIGGFSAHADREELMRFLTRANLEVKQIAVVHGEEEQSLGLAKHLSQKGFKAQTPQPGETIAVG